MRLSVITSLILLSLPLTTAQAGSCKWQWDCSSGRCNKVPICDNKLDVPPIDAPTLPPISSPTVQPLNMPTLPPIGTRSCHMAQICDNSNHCHWEQVCQ